MNTLQKLAAQYIYWPELDNPFQKNIDFSQNTLSQISHIFKDNLKGTKISAEGAIVQFYTINQFLSQQRIKDGNVLNKDLLDTYQNYRDTLGYLSQKMFTYIFFVSLMEARHCYDFQPHPEDVDIDIEVWADEYEAQHGKFPTVDMQKQKRIDISNKYQRQAMKPYRSFYEPDFHKSFTQCFGALQNLLSSQKSDYAQECVKTIVPFLESSDITLHDFMKTLSIIFQKSHFDPAFGGQAWQHIVECGLKFAKGDISAEVFLDQSFSLEHNDGSMFNKNIIFKEVENIHLSTAHANQSTWFSKDYIYIDRSQFFLNMQHEGQLLNFFHLANFTKPQIKKAVWNNLKNDKETKDLRQSVYQFLIEVKEQAQIYVKYPAIQKILQRQQDYEGIDFLRILNTCTINGHKRKLLKDDSKKETVEHAFYVTNQLFNPLKNNVIISPKNSDYFHYLNISDIPKDLQTKEALGGKAYGLMQMKHLNLPVPAALTWPCENFISYTSKPDTWCERLQENMQAIEKFSKNSAGHDILVSIRSGAPVSMPGMMDTILNVGIDNSNYHYFVHSLGKNTTDKAAILFTTLFVKSYFNKDIKPQSLEDAQNKLRNILKSNHLHYEKQDFPLSKSQQIQMSLEAVFQSFNSERALAYREHHQISHQTGTAATLQHMAMGSLNNNSCTGVIFSRDCINGTPGMIGEFLVCAQGEEVVSGQTTPYHISKMKKWNKELYNQLSDIAKQLEVHNGTIQDIEFTVENGQLFILQCREAVASPMARMKLLKEKLDNKDIDFGQFLKQIDYLALNNDYFVNTKQKADFSGLSANPGVISGVCITSLSDIDKYQHLQIPFILIAQETKPEHAPLMMKADAFLTQSGGFTCHAAILSRSWNKPCIVGASSSRELKSGDLITMDSTLGKVWKSVEVISQREESTLVKEIIASQKIDIQALSQSKKLNKLNKVKSWMYFSDKTVEKPPISHQFDKFLDMGQLALIKMSLAAKEMSQKKLQKNNI